MRIVSFLGVLMFLNFATAGLGFPLTGEQGKLSISNLAPVLFILIAGGCYLVQVRTIKRSLLFLYASFNVAALVSFVIFMFRYGWQPNVPVLVFQDVEILFALLLIWYARRDPEEFLRVAKWGILVSAAISATYGLRQFTGPGTFSEYGFMTFGMDDKSQAAVLFCCQAYILVRFYHGWLVRIVAACLMAMSFMTLSRLPAVFVIVMLLTIASRARYGWILALLSVCIIAGIFVVEGEQIFDVFKVFERLSSIGAATGDDSTAAHLLLIDAALQMKFSDAITLIFGIGPGNFSQALTSFPLDLSRLDSVDPQLIAEARIGRAPMHSTPVSLLLDYNIAVVFILFHLFMRALYFLFREAKYLDLTFFLSLTAASMFYSVHNKPYLFLLIATIAAGLLGGRRAGGDLETVGAAVMPVT